MNYVVTGQQYEYVTLDMSIRTEETLLQLSKKYQRQNVLV